MKKFPVHGTKQTPELVSLLRAELFPFRSQLLKESLLVSFPPLINMLKFRG